MRRAWFSTAACGICLAITVRAAAEPTAADKETARRFMAEGRARRDGGNLDGALQSFQAADTIMRVPTTGLEVAKTEAALGHLVDAREKVLAILRIPQAKSEPKPFVDARAAAQAMSDDLESRIPTIKLSLHGAPAGVLPTATVDGVDVPAASLALPHGVDPGHHVIVVKVGDRPAQHAEVDVAERANRDVTLDLAAGPTPPASAEDTSPTQEPSPPQDVRPARSHTLTYVAFGVGGAGIVVGAVTGLLALSHLNAAKNGGCVDDRCPPQTDGNLNTAGTMATISDVGFILGGVGIVAGVITLVVNRPRKTDNGHAVRQIPSQGALQEGGVQITPWLTPGGAGLYGRF